MSVLNPRKLPAMLWVFPSELDGDSPAMPCLSRSLWQAQHLQGPRHHGKLSCSLSAVVAVGVSSPDWGRILPKEYGLAYNCIRTTRGHTHRVGPKLSSTPLLSIFLGLWCSRALGDSLRCFVWNAKTWYPMISGINLISKSNSELALGHLYFSGFLSTSPYQKEFWFHSKRGPEHGDYHWFVSFIHSLVLNHMSSSFCVSSTVLSFVGHKWFCSQNLWR